ncbi:hypothetical protein HPB48_023224 [Haemaphysalis longicornis]|uniref:Uncharacterized protein n=1 Tax=Haemaphysalis longicornis TaxID=44386 RepID=A0A9J6GW14_HAELO|nr:hypothetical protein HPB48_023224 [Haemaphysalis longicornis]
MKSKQEEEAAPPPAAIVHPEHEDAELILSRDLVRLIKRASPCAAVHRRQDIMDRDEYYNLMRMTNAEQFELLREIIHRQTDAVSTSVTGLLHQAGRLRQDVCPPDCHEPLQPVQQRQQQRRLQRVRPSARAPERRLWQLEEPRCTRAFKPHQGQRPQRQRVEHLPRGLPQLEMRDHRRG